MAGEPGDEGDQWRLVNVAPGEMFAAGEVIQFVAEISVMIDSGKLDQQPADRERREQQAGIAQRSQLT